MPVPNLVFPVAPPEYIMAMKFAAGRAFDIGDIEWMLSAKVADTLQTEKIIHQHLGPYAADEFLLLVDEIAWMAKR